MHRLAIRLVSLALLAGVLAGPCAPALAESENPDRFVVTLAGDCTLGSEPQHTRAESSFISQINQRGFDWPFSGVIDLFSTDDLTLINLEGVFTEHNQAQEKSFTFRAPPVFADILTVSSIEAVNLANNHSRDFGQQGYDDTKAALDERSIAYCGPGETTVTEIKGIKIALLGVTYPLLETKMSALCKRIGEYRAQGDIALIIVSFHWGYEMEYKQRNEQVKAAHRAIDSGADAVVGTHPHVLQGMEMYKEKPVFYSLANFSFGGNGMPKDRDTAVVQLEYALEDGVPRLIRLEVIPYLISEAPIGKVQDYRPIEAPLEDAPRIFKKLSKGAKGLPEDFFETGYWELEPLE